MRGLAFGDRGKAAAHLVGLRVVSAETMDEDGGPDGGSIVLRFENGSSLYADAPTVYAQVGVLLGRDYGAMNDATLAASLGALYARYSERPEDAHVEDIALAENEVCARAEIPLDDTEQGLTEQARETIRAWMAANGTVSPL